MENPIRITKKFNKIVGGELITDNSKNIDIPSKKAIAMSLQAMFLNGEMDIGVEDYTGIKENGETKARIDNKYPKVLVSKKLLEEESIKAVKQYMEEKDIKSIKDIIKEQEKSSKEVSEGMTFGE